MRSVHILSEVEPADIWETALAHTMQNHAISEPVQRSSTRLAKVSGVDSASKKEGIPFQHWVVIVDGSTYEGANNYYHLRFAFANYLGFHCPSGTVFDGGLASSLNTEFQTELYIFKSDYLSKICW